MKLQRPFLLACLAAAPIYAQQPDEKSKAAPADSSASVSILVTSDDGKSVQTETRQVEAKPVRPRPAGRPVAAAPDQVPVPYIGVMTREVTPELRSQFSLKPGFGIMVDGVMPDSPAQKAGLKEYDILLKLDDQQLVTMEQFMVLVRARKKGDVVNLATISGGKESQISITLGEHLMPVIQERPQHAFTTKSPGGVMHFSAPNMPGVFHGTMPGGFQNQGKEMREHMERFQKEMQQYQERIQDWAKNGSQGPMPQPPALNLPGGAPPQNGGGKSSTGHSSSSHSSSGQSSSSSTSGGSGGGGGVPAVPMIPAVPGANVQQFTFNESHASSTVTRRDDTGEYTLKREDGKATFIARPNGGTEQSWPVNTEAERDAVPVPFRDKLKMMDGSGNGVRIQIRPAPPNVPSPPAPGRKSDEV